MKQIVFTALLGFALLPLALPAPAFAQDQCQLKLAASLDINTEPNGAISVPGAINGHPVRMLVDTGSVYSSVSGDVADELNLHHDTAAYPMQLAGGIPFTELAKADTFSLGQLTARQFQFYVVPRDVLSGNYMGMLGPDIMSNYDVELDFVRSKFNVFYQDHCPGQVIYWTREAYAEVPMTVQSDWHISVPVSLEGHDLAAFIDTGAEGSIMTMDTAHRVLGIDPGDPRLKKLDMISLNGAKKTNAYKYPFASLTFEGVAVTNPDIIIVDDVGIGNGMPPLLLGLNVLRQLHMYIAYKEQKLYLTAAEAH